MSDAVTPDLVSRHPVATVACPRCLAEPGERCVFTVVGPGGRPMLETVVHVARRVAYNRREK